MTVLALSRSEQQQVLVALQEKLAEQGSTPRTWPDDHDPDFAASSREEQEKALAEALDIGLAELDAGKGVRSTAETLLMEIDEDLGMSRGPL